MTQTDIDIQLSLEQLKKMNRLHRLELRKISKMSEAQFQAFKKNFSVGHLENITKTEAYELLTSMLALNLSLLDDLKNQKHPPKTSQ